MVLTSRRDAATIEAIFEAGADDYLAKPVLPAELRVRVRNRVERLQLHRRLSEVDGLTGVANRSTASHGLDRLLHLAVRNEQPLSLAIVDLDRFKAVNDRHGHPAGDEVLRRFGRALGQTFRGEDVVGRWGGEEFVIGMYGMSAGDASVRLEQLLAVFGDERFAGAAGSAFRVGFSAGVASFPEDGEDLPALHAAADRALYRAKDAGRRCVRLGHDLGP
jgi:diguanylate cyclase (GGDEF)-like protein